MASWFYYKKILFVNGILSNFTETSLGIYVGTIPSFRKIGPLVFEIKEDMISIFIYRILNVFKFYLVIQRGEKERGFLHDWIIDEWIWGGGEGRWWNWDKLNAITQESSK